MRYYRYSRVESYNDGEILGVSSELESTWFFLHSSCWMGGDGSLFLAACRGCLPSRNPLSAHFSMCLVWARRTTRVMSVSGKCRGCLQRKMARTTARRRIRWVRFFAFYSAFDFVTTAVQMNEKRVQESCSREKSGRNAGLLSREWPIARCSQERDRTVQ